MLLSTTMVRRAIRPSAYGGVDIARKIVRMLNTDNLNR